MDLHKTILYIYPELIPVQDFEVVNNWEENQYIIWNNEEIEPTTQQIGDAWIEVQEQERQAKIRQDISDTLIEFTTLWGVTWKFKIRKKDFAPILAQFMDVKENSVEPVYVFDYNYTPIPFVYQDFINYKSLVQDKQAEIITNNS